MDNKYEKQFKTLKQILSKVIPGIIIIIFFIPSSYLFYHLSLTPVKKGVSEAVATALYQSRTAFFAVFIICLCIIYIIGIGLILYSAIKLKNLK